MKERNIGYFLGQVAAIVACACIFAIMIALTAKFINWLM